MKLNTNCGNQNIIYFINLKTYLFCVCAAFLILNAKDCVIFLVGSMAKTAILKCN